MHAKFAPAWAGVYLGPLVNGNTDAKPRSSENAAMIKRFAD